jgi:hypothetical protein
LALFYLGQLLDAREEFARALRFDGDPCRVRPFMIAANALIDGILPGSEPSVVAEFLVCCRKADNLLGIGEAAEAWKVLDQFNVWRLEDAQGGARLALAALLHPSTDPAFGFRRRHAVAQHLYNRKNFYHNRMVLSSIHWPPEQLDEVEAMAKAYLSKSSTDANTAT